VTGVARLALWVCLALLSHRVSLAACDDSVAESLVSVLSRGVTLNEQFKQASVSGDEALYRSLRQQHESYTEDEAVPCLEKAVLLLSRATDEPHLLKSVMAFAVSHQNVADERIADALAFLFARQPAAVERAMGEVSRLDARAVVSLIESGWPAVRDSLPVDVGRDTDLRLEKLRDTY
jgi:hypothetical protein